MLMNKNTLENYYKTAVKNKYEEIKDGEDFIYLNPPTRARLNKFCWEIFERNKMHSDDLVALNSLLGLPFDLNTKNKFRQQTNQFRPIETFFKGETDPEKMDVVDLAAILVDFQPRPFAKFRKQIDEEDLKLINELRNTNNTKEVSEETKTEDVKPKVQEVRVEEEVNVDAPKEENIISETIEVFQPESKPIKINLFVNVKEKLIHNFKNRLKKIAVATILIFCLIGAVIYFAFFKKHCMQWSEDHYEVVDCSSKDKVVLNEIIPLDENLLDFRKLKACDTTRCFMENGDAFVWYSKTPNGIDFFNDNGNGKHPVTNRALRPVTQYIVGKYLKGKPCE
ncbi:hypothetical protein FLGSB24_41780 [Flavobacterium sp. GSB-24]|nr:hypothetical protein FLGSB24_41780 [Flavobacterium sp. GSB-24]